jgi:hypothetical protein
MEDGAVVKEGRRDDTNPNAPSIPILMLTYWDQIESAVLPAISRISRTISRISCIISRTPCSYDR